MPIIDRCAVITCCPASGVDSLIIPRSSVVQVTSGDAHVSTVVPRGSMGVGQLCGSCDTFCHGLDAHAWWHARIQCRSRLQTFRCARKVSACSSLHFGPGAGG